MSDHRPDCVKRGGNFPCTCPGNENAALRAKLTTAESERDCYKARCEELVELLRDVMGNIGEMGPKGPCPVCWTYTHKHWCWYERAKSAIAATEK